MKYTQTEFPKKTALADSKQAVTYLLIAPPPPDNPFMQDAWWQKNKVHSLIKPVSTIKFNNGYKIEKFNLTATESAIPAGADIDPGLFFR